jgi:PTH1 family peptidyl-tRNA hydrolase
MSHMSYVLVGLGNPGPEYEKTRHNTGRIVLEIFRKKCDFPDWEPDKKLKALVSKGKLGKAEILLLEPETFMNNSGGSVKPLITSKKKAESLVIIHDDLDLPIGSYKISFNRGSGGHKGVENIIKAIGTEGFVRVRVGISPVTPGGKLKKPSGRRPEGRALPGGGFHLVGFQAERNGVAQKGGEEDHRSARSSRPRRPRYGDE